MARRYFVWNETDGLHASPDSFRSIKAAAEFMDTFLEARKLQGYYLTTRRERIPVEEVVLLVQDSKGKVYAQRGTGPQFYAVDLKGLAAMLGVSVPQA